MQAVKRRKKKRGARVLKPAGALAVYDGDVYIADFPALYRCGGVWIAVPESDRRVVVGGSLREVLRKSGMRKGDLLLIDESKPPFRTA